MKRNQIITSLGALTATGLAIYLIRRRKRSNTDQENYYDSGQAHAKTRSRTFGKAKLAIYEPDDHPE